MKRVNVVYSISLQEYKEEVERLLETSNHYLSDFSSMLKDASALVENDNYEGCVKTIAQMRDKLAEADYRLHDVMNLILQKLQQDQRQNSSPVQPVEAQEDNGQNDVSLSKVQERMKEVRENIKELGIQLPEEQLQDIMGKLDDKTNRGV